VVELLFNGNADDTSGNAHHGVVHGATPTADRFGRAEAAFQFDGTDDYIVIAPPPRLGEQHFSVSVWARFDRVDDTDVEGWTNCVVCQDNGDDDDQSRRVFQLSMNGGRVVWHRMTQARDPSARKVASVATWYHLAAVVETGTHRLYIDGKLVDSVRHTVWVHADEPIHIGRKGTPEPYFFFRGAIDDLRVYDRALSAEEVRVLRDEGGG
jgi:hypothetical protein